MAALAPVLPEMFRGVVCRKWRDGLPSAARRAKDGARCRFRTCDPYRVKVMLYR